MKTKREEQFRTGFRSVQWLRPWVTAKVLMLLVMLMVSVSGAWAQEYPFSSQCYGTEGASNNEGPASLLDNNENTKWCIVRKRTYDELPATPSVIFRVKTNVKLSQYKFKTADDTGKYPQRNPKNWTLEAKYSREDAWVVISSVENASLPSASLTESDGFSVNAEYQNKSFRYFRLTFDETYDFQLADIIFIGEFAEVDADDDNLTLPDPTVSGDTTPPGVNPSVPGNNSESPFSSQCYGTEGASSDEGPASLLDNNQNTKWCVASWTEEVPYVIFRVKTSIKPSQYRFRIANDTYSYPERNPKCWKLEAKYSRADEWVTISTVTGATLPTESFIESANFVIGDEYKNQSFRYFRLVFGATENFQMSDFLLEGEYAEVDAADDDLTLPDPTLVGDSEAPVPPVNPAEDYETGKYNGQTPFFFRESNVTGNSEYAYTRFALLDGLLDINDDFETKNSNTSVEFRVETSVKPSRYCFVTSYYCRATNNTNPDEWKLEAKYKNSDEWTVISEESNMRSLLDIKKQKPTRNFNIKEQYTNQPFRYFRLTFGNLGGAEKIALNDFWLFGTYLTPEEDKNHPDNPLLGYTSHVMSENATGPDGVTEAEGVCALFDGNPSTAYKTSSSNPVIEFRVENVVTPKSYYFVSAPRISENTGKRPHYWTLEAKLKTSDEWTTIAQNGEYAGLSEVSCEKSMVYDVDSDYAEEKYRYFRLSFTDNPYDGLMLGEFVINGEYLGKDDYDHPEDEHIIPPTDSDDYNHNGVIYSVRPSKGYATVIGYTGNATDVVIPATLDYFGVPCSVDSIRHHAFQENRTITSISIPKSLKCIGASAFDNCSALKDVIFTGTDNLLNTIEEYAFKLSGVTNFDFTALPNLESIGVGAFESAKVQTVDFSQSTKLTNLGEFIFADCNVQGSVDLSAFTTLPKGLFAGCSKLTSFTLHPDIESIPDYIFRGTGVTAVDLSAYPKISSVGIFAFSECQNLTSIVLPNNMEVLQRESLSACGKLTSVTLPANLKTIESAAFAGCSSLASLTFPASLELISAQAFQGTAFTEIDFSSAPDATLLNGVFGGCAQLARVVMPTNNTEVGNELFKGCTSLTEVVLPANATRIGQRAFEDCTGLTAISLPSSVSLIDEGAFHNCSNLQTFTMPASLVTIGNYAFEGCAKLPDFTLPATLTSIGSSAFKGCTLITSVTIPDEVTVIKANTFSGCSKLTSLNLGTSKMKLRKLESDAFAGCPLTNIMVYSTLDNWDNQTTTAPFSASAYENATVTFGACPKGDVRNLKVWKEFQNLVGMVKKYHTYVCPGLTDCEVHFYALPTYSYNIKEDFGIHNINGAVLVSGSATGDIVLPDEVEGFPIVGIAKSIFNENDNVTSISFPGTLRMIENNAVELMSNLKKVVFRDQKFPRGEKCYIGYAVYSVIDEEAFYECNKLEEVIIGCDLDWYDGEDEPFEDRDNLKRIRITAGCHVIGKSSGNNQLFNDATENVSEFIIEDSDEELEALSLLDTFPYDFDELEKGYLGRPLKISYNDGQTSFFGSPHAYPTVTVGDNITYIDHDTFYGFHGKVHLGRNIKEIGDRAFQEAWGIEGYCPKLETIGKYAFESCKIDYNFWCDEGDPQKSSLKSIGDYAFEYSKLTEIRLPASIETIGRCNFADIFTIYLYKDVRSLSPAISKDVFGGATENHASGYTKFTLHTLCLNNNYGDCGFPHATTPTGDYHINMKYDIHSSESKENTAANAKTGLYTEVCNTCGTDDGRSAKSGNYYIHNWNGSDDIMIHKSGSSYTYAGPLDIDDSKPFQSPVSFSAQSVSYNRTVTGGRVVTFVLPFAADASDVNGTVYKFREFSDSKFCFDEQTGSLDANIPYLVVVNEDGPLLSSVDATTLSATVNTTLSPLACNVTNGTAQHVGSFVQQTFADGQNGKSYYGYASTDGAFVKAKTATLNPFRTMFALPSGSQAKRITLQLGGDDTTSIINVDADLLDSDGSPMYDLNGRIVTTPVRGQVYIQDGRKIVKR